MTEYRIIRYLEDDNLIIYKRMFSLKGCGTDKRFFEVKKRGDYTGIQDYTGNQWNNPLAVKKYWKKLHEEANNGS